MKNFIVYEITNKINNKKYIGCHVTKNLNDDYMGSGKYLKNAIKKYGIENFEKIILHYCDNEIEMLRKERELVNEDIVNSDDYYNLSLGGNSFYHINNNLETSSINKVIVKDEQGNILKVKKDNKDYLNGKLISIRKEKTLCKDINNDYYWINTKDERYLDTLQPINKGLVLAKNSDDKIMMIDKDNEQFKNGEFKPFWFNRKHTDETKRKIGEKNSIHQKGEKNSQFGTCWIILEKEKKCIKINKIELKDYIKKGWKKGRKMNW